MPTVLLGYYFAKQKIFQKIRIPRHWSMALIGIILIAVALIGYAICGSVAGFSLYVIYSPLAIFNSTKLTITTQILTSLGNLSVYMWFMHALYFTDIVRAIYQPFILISDNIFIITLWTILLTYACSLILKWAVDTVGNSISKTNAVA